GAPAGPSSLGREPAEEAPELGLVDDVNQLGGEVVAAVVPSFGSDPVEHSVPARCKNRATCAQAVNTRGPAGACRVTVGQRVPAGRGPIGWSQPAATSRSMFAASVGWPHRRFFV